MAKAGLVGTWLRDLSDAYTSFHLDGSKDLDPARLPGPAVVNGLKKAVERPRPPRQRPA